MATPKERLKRQSKLAGIPALRNMQSSVTRSIGGPTAGIGVGQKFGGGRPTYQKSNTPTNPATKAWNKTPSSNLEFRSSLKPQLSAGPKGSIQKSGVVKPWTTAETGRFNRPVGEYRKVQRPGMQTSAPVGRFHGDGGVAKIGSSISSMPDFSGGNSRANKAVQRSREFSWMKDRAQGQDAMDLARVRGSEQRANTAMEGSNRIGVAQMGLERQRQSDVATNQLAEATRTAGELQEQALERSRNRRASEAITSREKIAQGKITSKEKTAKNKAYDDYKKKFLGDSLNERGAMLSEEDFFGTSKDPIDYSTYNF